MIRVFHMDKRAAEGQLVRALDFAQILAQLIIGPCICGTGDGAAIAPGEPTSRHRYADVRLCERLRLDAEIGPGAALVANLLDRGARYRCTEAADRP